MKKLNRSQKTVLAILGLFLVALVYFVVTEWSGFLGVLQKNQFKTFVRIGYIARFALVQLFFIGGTFVFYRVKLNRQKLGDNALKSSLFLVLNFAANFIVWTSLFLAFRKASSQPTDHKLFGYYFVNQITFVILIVGNFEKLIAFIKKKEEISFKRKDFATLFMVTICFLVLPLSITEIFLNSSYTLSVLFMSIVSAVFSATIVNKTIVNVYLNYNSD